MKFKPQLYRTAGRVDDAEVTGLAASADGTTLYAAGRFTTVASSPTATGVVRKGVAAFNATTGAVKTTFNAKVCSAGGPCAVNAVKRVGSTVWLGGDFTSIGGTARTALAAVNPTTGGLNNAVALSIAGQPITTTPTKVTKISLNPSSTKAVVLGNFNAIGGQTREEVAVLNADPATGAAKSVNTWNAPTHLHTAVLNCNRGMIWPQDADWSPDGAFFDIVGSGAGGFHPYPAQCDAFTRWADNNNPNSVPTGYNHTEIDTILSVCSVGQWSYVGGHFKSLNQERRLNGTIVEPPPAQVNETHYGLGVIDTSPTNMLAVTNWNHSDQTGRGAGWGAALCVPGPAASGGGVYMGGDSKGVNGNPQIERLAYFAATN